MTRDNRPEDKKNHEEYGFVILQDFVSANDFMSLDISNKRTVGVYAFTGLGQRTYNVFNKDTVDDAITALSYWRDHVWIEVADE